MIKMSQRLNLQTAKESNLQIAALVDDCSTDEQNWVRNVICQLKLRKAILIGQCLYAGFLAGGSLLSAESMSKVGLGTGSGNQGCYIFPSNKNPDGQVCSRF